MRITVFGSKELQAVLLAVKTVNRDTRKEIRKHTQTMAAPEWQKAMGAKASTDLERRVLVSTARVRVSDQNVTLMAASVGRALPGGLSIKDQWHAVEYGAADTEVTYQARNRQGTTYNVTRNTRAQLKVRKKAGYVVGPAAAAIIPRIASLWVQTTARTIYDKLEGKG